MINSIKGFDSYLTFKPNYFEDAIEEFNELFYELTILESEWDSYTTNQQNFIIEFLEGISEIFNFYECYDNQGMNKLCTHISRFWKQTVKPCFYAMLQPERHKEKLMKEFSFFLDNDS